jgi:hypothetical protein
MVRPDRVAAIKATGHGVVLALAVTGLLIILVSSYASVLTDEAALAGAGVAGVAGLVHLVLALYNPNWSRHAQQEQAALDVDAGKVTVLQPGSTDALRNPARLSPAHLLALLGLVAAPAAFLLPWHLRTTNHWPVNLKLDPQIISPGDKVLIHFPDPGLRSMNGLWRASARAELLNAAEIGGPATIPATSKTDDWGNKVWVREPSYPSLPEDSPMRQLFAYLHLPNDAALGGKTLRVRITMEVMYPTYQRPTGWDILENRKGSFLNKTSPVSTEVTVQLTPAGGSEAYQMAWALAAGIGGLGYLVSGLGLRLLAQAQRSKAKPVELIPLLS